MANHHITQHTLLELRRHVLGLSRTAIGAAPGNVVPAGVPGTD
eukprot:SAG22_NODE_560_length_9102_cov_54.310785_11_plen_43_part_00